MDCDVLIKFVLQVTAAAHLFANDPTLAPGTCPVLFQMKAAVAKLDFPGFTPELRNFRTGLAPS